MFKVGDKVVCVVSYSESEVRVGEICKVVELSDHGPLYCKIRPLHRDVSIGYGWVMNSEIELVEDEESVQEEFDRLAAEFNESAFDKQTGGNHYKDLKIQPMEYALANKLDLAQGNVVKYVTRFRAKNGIEDLRKAIHCIELLIEFEENNIDKK